MGTCEGPDRPLLLHISFSLNTLFINHSQSEWHIYKAYKIGECASEFRYPRFQMSLHPS